MTANVKTITSIFSRAYNVLLIFSTFLLREILAFSYRQAYHASMENIVRLDFAILFVRVIKTEVKVIGHLSDNAKCD